MFVVIKKMNIFVVLLIFGLSVMTFMLWASDSIATNAEPPSADFIIIDAGHGGEDGGAVGVSGSQEKDLNLAVALKVEAMLEEAGIPVIMTRDEDVSLTDPGKGTIRARKTSDMKNRLKLVQEAGTKVYIGIHMNQFTEAKYKGAQVFYSGNNPESKVLGELMQETIKKNINDGNARMAQQAGSGIYLLKNAKPPAIIVECGMLSNPGEEKLLLTAEYQQKMAESIVMGLKEYLKGK